MSNKPKALMSQYVEGCLVTRELRDMLADGAAQARFDREMVDDVELVSGGQGWGKYHEISERYSNTLRGKRQ